MASQYYLDLEAFSLEKFKRTLEKEEVMPARQIQKEDHKNRPSLERRCAVCGPGKGPSQGHRIRVI